MSRSGRGRCPTRRGRRQRPVETSSSFTGASTPNELARLRPSRARARPVRGEAWLGVVGCSGRASAARGLPPLPGLSSALELELRTYVTDGGAPRHLAALSRGRATGCSSRRPNGPTVCRPITLGSNWRRSGDGCGSAPSATEASFEARLAGVGRWFAPGPTRSSTSSASATRSTAPTAAASTAPTATTPQLRVRRARVDSRRRDARAAPARGKPPRLLGGSQDTLRWPLEEL